MASTNAQVNKNFSPNQFIVQFNPGVSDQFKQGFLHSLGATGVTYLQNSSLALVKTTGTQDISQVITKAAQHPSVQFVERDFVVDTTATGASSTTYLSELLSANQKLSLSQKLHDLNNQVSINLKEVNPQLRYALKDFDRDGIITFKDLNSPQNAGLVKDSNGNQFIDIVDILKDYRWADRIDQDGDGYADNIINFNNRIIQTPTPPITPNPIPRDVYTIYGASGASDVIQGSQFDNKLSGISQYGPMLGQGTRDKLIGGGGNDLFILGDARGHFYDSGDNTNSGASDHAQILDFAAGDKIQLAKGNYFFQKIIVPDAAGLGIFYDSNLNGKYEVGADELIGIVAGVNTINPATDIVFVERTIPVPSIGAGPAPNPNPAGDFPIYGASGASDVIKGNQFDNKLSGVSQYGPMLGQGTRDKLIGGGGNDLFILGDARGRFYDDGKAQNSGASDHAQILDFAAGDKIQLAKGNYFFQKIIVPDAAGLGIFYDSNLNGKYEVGADELIGIVAGVNTINTATDIVFV